MSSSSLRHEAAAPIGDYPPENAANRPVLLPEIPNEAAGFAYPVPATAPEARIHPNENLSAAIDRFAGEAGVAPEVWEGSRRLLDTLARHSPADYAHSLRGCYYNYGLELQKPAPERDPAFAVVAAAVHDVGKIGIDNSILDFRGTFGAAHWASIHRHPIIGADLLKPIDRDVALATGLHHAFQADGYGIDLDAAIREYGLDQQEVTRVTGMARQIMLIDVFDATLTRRDRGGYTADASPEQQRQLLLSRFPDSAAQLDWLFAHRIGEI
jgi:hypothetical protein